MAKYLFVVPPFPGHINPTLGIGEKLLDRGHKVGWISIDPAFEQEIPTNGDFILLEFPMDEVEQKKVEQHLEDLSKRSVYGLDSLKFLYEEVLVPMNTKMLDPIIQTLDDYQPDVIINDHQLFAAAVAAKLKNIPYATSVTAPAAIKEDTALPNIHKWETEQIVNFQQRSGIIGNDRLDCSDLLTLVYTTREFFGENNFSENYQFIGPIINRPSPSDLDLSIFDGIKDKGNTKNIFVSIGTMFDHTQKKKFFDKVIEAFANNSLYNVIVVSHPEIFESIPSNFYIYEFVPQLELMPYMDIVICHAGHNTVCEALYNLKPLVVLPVAYDQSFVASCVTNSGCGIRLNFNRFRSEQLKDAVNTILLDDKFEINANKIQESFIKAGGSDKAVEMLEGIISK